MIRAFKEEGLLIVVDTKLPPYCVAIVLQCPVPKDWNTQGNFDRIPSLIANLGLRKTMYLIL